MVTDRPGGADMTAYQNRTKPLDDRVINPVSTAAAQRQLALYQRVYRIPAEIVPDLYGAPLVQMPVSASYCALTVPARMAPQILLRLVDAAAILYPLEHTAAVLMFPDARLAPAVAAAFDRAGIVIAPYGSSIRLPVEGSECPWRWLRTPSTPAHFPRLWEIVMSMRWTGIAGPLRGTA